MAGDMSRLFVHVEGQTEEKFVYEVLAPHLYSSGYQSVVARLLGNQRSRANRGGIRPWASTRIDIVNQMVHDPGSIATVMVDYYGLPHTGGRAWPGRAGAEKLPFAHRASSIENALAADLAPDVDLRRFLPFVVMHEFEGLLFSDCAALCRAIESPSLEARSRKSGQTLKLRKRSTIRLVRHRQSESNDYFRGMTR